MRARPALVILVILVVALGLPACQTAPTGSRAVAETKPGGTSWWRDWNDPALTRDIAAAFAASPGLQMVAAKIARADALVADAEGAMKPSVNLGFNYLTGRQRNIDFGPFDLPPWQSGAFLSWEADLSGKLRAARNLARESRAATVQDLELARLVLGTRLAGLRLQLYRLNAEVGIVAESLQAARRTLEFLKERRAAGIVADPVVDQQKAALQSLARQRLELERKRDLTLVQLRTLRGGSAPGDPGKARFPRPERWQSRPLDEVLQDHPRLKAAAARVRSAFQLQRSARLNLLPSFRIEALATGRQTSLADRFRVWSGQIGPSLDLPVYDPARLAQVKLRQAEAKMGAAQYREAVLEVLEDLDGARINLASRQSQLAAVRQESEARKRARDRAQERLEKGVISEIDFLELEQKWLESRQMVERLQQGVLMAQLEVVKASGGGRP